MRRARKSMNQINVVPYIDVMLVLLVIFMVTAPLVNPGEIELPSVGARLVAPVQPMEVTLRTDGSSISPGVTSGAVTMKITSSTSITSMYGTTLIWLIGLRTRRIVSDPGYACRCRMFENSSMNVS